MQDRCHLLKVFCIFYTLSASIVTYDTVFRWTHWWSAVLVDNPWTSGRSDIRTSGRLDVRTPDVQTSGRLDVGGLCGHWRLSPNELPHQWVWVRSAHSVLSRVTPSNSFVSKVLCRQSLAIIIFLNRSDGRKKVATD